MFTFTWTTYGAPDPPLPLGGSNVLDGLGFACVFGCCRRRDRGGPTKGGTCMKLMQTGVGSFVLQAPEFLGEDHDEVQVYQVVGGWVVRQRLDGIVAVGLTAHDAAVAWLREQDAPILG